MSDSIIHVEGLGKKYILQHQREHSSAYRYKALRDVIADRVKSLTQGFAKPSQQPMSDPTQEEFWALRNVAFEIKDRKINNLSWFDSP